MKRMVSGILVGVLMCALAAVSGKAGNASTPSNETHETHGLASEMQVAITAKRMMNTVN